MPKQDRFPGFPSPEQVAATYFKTSLIAATLRRSIQNGTVPMHTQLPRGTDGGRALGVSSKTIFNAYELLKNEGLVEGGRGKGLFVGGPSPDSPFSTRKATQFDIVYDDLVAQIATGELTPGMYIPSISNLKEMYRVSHGVVLKVKKALFRNQLTEGISGHGSVVSHTVKPDPQRYGRFPVMEDITDNTWERNVRKRGYEPSIELGKFSTENALPFIASQLQIPATTEVVTFSDTRFVRYPERRMLFDRTTFYFPSTSAQQIGVLDSDGTRNEMWKPKSMTTREVHEISTETPDHEERILFRIPEGVPLLQNVTTLFDRSDHPYGVAIRVFPGNRGVIKSG